MEAVERVEVNPKIMLGKAVIRGTRIPVDLLLRKLGEGATTADLLDAYPRLTVEDVRAAISFGDRRFETGATVSRPGWPLRIDLTPGPSPARRGEQQRDLTYPQCSRGVGRNARCLPSPRRRGAGGEVNPR